jgi:hypothetical protein
MSKEMEDALGALGFEVTSGEVPEGTQLNEPSFEIPQGADVIDLSESNVGIEPEFVGLPSEPIATQETQVNPEPGEVQSSLINNEIEPEMSEQEFEAAVASYVSEKLGVSIDSIEHLTQLLEAQKAPSIDERIKVIADFVAETGRDPLDWFKYQSINPSEMDELNAVKLQMTIEYPSLSNEEIELLLDSKYKTNSSIYSDEEVKLSSIQLKLDAEKARKGIETLRQNFKAPLKQEAQEANIESPIDQQWISTMSKEVDELEALTFDLNGQEFNFGLTDDYKGQLKQKNVQLDQFFDQYVDEGGRWDFELLNSHRAVLDNIDEIVKSVYNQGMSDGQRKLVDKAANIDVSSPRTTAPQSTDNVAQQIYNYLYGDNGLKIKI